MLQVRMKITKIKCFLRCQDFSVETYNLEKIQFSTKIVCFNLGFVYLYNYLFND